MTNEDVIETIKANYPSENYTMLREALDVALAVLEKQEPKQIIDMVEFFKGMKTGRCPSCARSLVNLDIDETKFCKICGQAVKWND